MSVKKTLSSLKISGIVIITFLFFNSISNAAPTSHISDEIRLNIVEKIIVENPVQVSGIKLYTFSNLRSFYESVDFRPRWLNNDSSAYNIDALLGIIDLADAEGLIARNYHKDEIKHKIYLIHQWETEQQADSLADLDILLTDAALAYAEDISVGQFFSKDDNVSRYVNMNAFAYASGLKLALDSGNVSTWLLSMSLDRPVYTALKNELVVYKEIYAKGGLIKLDYNVTKLRPGDTGQFIWKLRNYLTQTGDMRIISPADSNTFDTTLENGIRHFQLRFGLKQTGYVTGMTFVAMNEPAEERVANIMGSMERLRWLPIDSGQKYLEVNITDYSLQVVNNHKPELKMKIIVGKPLKQTPVFQAMMRTVVINPSWEVPWSIMIEEMLPKLQKSTNYLAHNHLKIFNLKGIEINPDTVKWADITPDNFRYRIVQVPGKWNSLGRVKFLFPNPYDVYLHGTPDQYLFAKDVRTFSHGCMRVEDPPALAACLLKDQGYDKKLIEEQIKDETEKLINLNQHVPVYVTYLTSWVDEDGHVCFRDDVYNRDDIFMEYVVKHEAELGMSE